MTKVHLFKWLVAVGLVLGLSSCGNVVNEPAAEQPGLETQETFNATVFVSTLEFSSGKCADVPRSTKRAGADLIQYDCNKQENQLFVFEAVDEASYYTVKSLASDLCMSVSPRETLGGNPVVEQTACTGAPNQQFGIIFVSIEDVGVFGIEAGRDSNRCLSVNNRSGQNRAPLVAVACDENGNSANGGNRWSLQNYNPAFTTEMIYERTGKCADVPRFSKQEGTDLIVYRCNGQTNQQFEFFKVGGSGTELDGENFLIKGVDSGLCITLLGTRAADNLVIEQRACTGEANQRFRLNVFGGEEIDSLLEIDTLYFQCLAAEPAAEIDPFDLRSDRSSARDYDNLIPDVCDSARKGYALWKLPGARDAVIGSF